MSSHAKWKFLQHTRRLRWNATHQNTNWLKRGLINFAWALSVKLISVGRKIRLIMFQSVTTDDRDSRPPNDFPATDDGSTPAPLEPFPGDFLWGAATAAIQAEGCIDNTDWNLFTTNPEIVRRVGNQSAVVSEVPTTLQHIGAVVHHGDLEVLKKDLDRAVLIGLNAYRFSIEWARVMPDGPDDVDQAALEYYSDAVDEMLKRQLTPIVTLNHVSLPLWICTPPVESGPPVLPAELRDAASMVNIPLVAVEDEGYRNASGWESADTIDHYIDFVQVVLDKLASQVVQDKLASKVRFWITLNEPTSMATIGYLGGIWPPGFSFLGDGAERAKTAYFNLLKAHAHAFNVIKNHYSTLELDPPHVGVALAIVHFSISSEVSAEAQAAWDGAVTGGVIGLALGVIIGALVGVVFTSAAVAVLGPVGLIVGPAIVAVIGGLAGAIIFAAIGALSEAIWGHFHDINKEARDQADYFYNRHFLDSLTSGSVDLAINHHEESRQLQDAVEFFKLGDSKFTPKLDFIGVNYYRNASTHYDPLLGHKAAYTGGAVFNNDMRHARDNYPFQNFRTEEHGILNDLGWDVFPEGISIMLEELREYDLPIIIAENGFAESNDRNRAPYLLAHLQQIRIAMERDIKVIGYFYWTLVDNYEWQAGYEPEGRFGLFRVVRPSIQTDVRYNCEEKPVGETFDRRITEGALVLQYVIACNRARISPFESAIERFGIMAPNGKSIVPPTKQAGALWEATVEQANEQTRTFHLYLTQLGSQSGLLGMIFDNDKREWIRLERIQVDKDGTGRVELHFQHPIVIWVEVNGHIVPMHRSMIYSATTSLTSEAGVFTPLEGTLRLDLMPSEHRWTASRNLKVGLWKTDIFSEDVHLAIRNWEGELFGPFQLKYLIGSVSWEPRRASTTWTDSTLDVTSVSSWNLIQPLSLNASLAGTSLSGTAQMRGPIGFTPSISWTASRVLEDVEF